MTYIPTHVHTCWSLLDSTLAVSDLAKKAANNNMPAVCLTDHHNIKCCVSFFKALKERGVKPIIGCELNVFSEDKESYNRVTVLAKNSRGFRNIVKMVSLGNAKENISVLGIPCISFEQVRSNCSNLACLIGDIKSELCESIYENPAIAIRASSEENCRSCVVKNWEEKFDSVLRRYDDIFENTFVFCDKSSLPYLSLFEKCVDLKTNGSYIRSNNVHYLNDGDGDLHEMILKSSDEIKKGKTSIFDSVDRHIFKTEKDECFLADSCDSPEEGLKLLDLIEDYDIQERPILPRFKVDGHTIKDPDGYLYDFCKSGFVSTGLIDGLKDNSELSSEYGKRISNELEVFKNAGISSYFLIVKDLIDFAHNLGIPADVRGSSSGCMASYLLGISSIDPMNPDPTMSYSPERELPFERFYNEGRNTKGNVSLADIDIDVPPSFREKMIDYARKTYGKDCVGHIITHSKFKARGAIKETFRLLKPVSNYFDVANEITKYMVEESKISEDIMERQEDDKDYGIIQWHIDNIEAISNYYSIYKEAFDLAIRLEQIPRNESVHAAGIIIADQPLSNLFPMAYSEKLDQLVIDIEGSDIEYIGGVKFDILGVAALEKIYQIQNMVNFKLTETEYGINV